MSVEVIETVAVFRTTQGFEINKLITKISLFCSFEKNVFEQNDEISSEILLSFSTEVVEDRGVLSTKTMGHMSNVHC